MAMFFSFIFMQLSRFFHRQISVHSFCLYFFHLNRHFFPYRRAHLTASALLQGIRSEGPHLHALRLASAAILTREKPLLTWLVHKKMAMFFSLHNQCFSRCIFLQSLTERGSFIIMEWLIVGL
jgi:hypothetical protein